MSELEPQAESAESGAGASMALTVCRLLRSPEARIRHGSYAGIAIRAALFAELVLDQRLSGVKAPKVRAPLPEAEPDLGRSLPDAVYRAVAANAAKPWRRWYGHVGADLQAAVAELVRSGTWEETSPQRYRDIDPELVAAQLDGVRQVLARPPAAGGSASLATEDVLVALLVGGAGPAGERPRPRAQLRRVDAMLPLFPEIKEQQETLRGLVKAALAAMRSRAGLRGLSG
ncbi:MAG: hypothetical protein JWN95_2451 [Frankiales bacterium]|nr:hypothetical protein [Frankiales bacterium]